MGGFLLSAFSDEVSSNLYAQIDALIEHDIKYMEIRGIEGINIIKHPLEKIRNIKRILMEKSVGISAVGSPIGKINIKDDFNKHLELFKYSLEVASILEAPFIRIFSFYISEDKRFEDCRNEVVDRLGAIVDMAKSYNITLLHENEKGIYGDTPQRCLDIFKTLNNPNFRAVFDPANFIQCNIEPYPYAFNILKDYIEYIHVKDARMSDKINVPAGQGDSNIKELLAELKVDGFTGYLSLEPHLGYFEGFLELEPHSDIRHMKKSNVEKFSIAVEALRSIIKEI
ncbi:sugar phosphate isomerase/epimerase family protein [Paramaledivibacter caminithermalis]|jgi:sugar phosphate isomerase/epimerase|uniref:Sugar phosphate isomerase/epimerase n=1 Tax=Paramaledivibacter caminithermalis (strain DSM 15212 / CIP 107654 / DViRD3) TaxID=1121301 RepID=A0A1M6NTA5_PARC5|nr:sugar phosphate isomerase/epimerase family protein [Paramaledivibacter caminithermalis]SHJ98875.1 Sugar phosphate isomerase/epimerase [Paramaledivibacter caminithermalis DSM 15212]